MTRDTSDLPALPTVTDPSNSPHSSLEPDSAVEPAPASEPAGPTPRRRVLPSTNVTRRDDEPAELPRTVSGRGRRPRPTPVAAHQATAEAAGAPKPARHTARPAAPAWDDADQDLDGQDWPIPAHAGAADDLPASPAWIDHTTADDGPADHDGHDDWPLPEGGSAPR